MATKTSPRKGLKTGGGTGPANVAKSHKSFQPILPCGNKLLQQKWDQTYYEQHRKLVASAKPMVDSKAPPARPHVTTKLKKQQLEKERYEEIDRDNMTLLRKMQHIMRTEGCVDHRNMYQHHSLNEEHRRREMVRVAKENKSLLKRLEDAKPMYKVSEWVNDWQRKEELTSMITAYPLAPGIPVASKIKGKDGSAMSPEDTVATRKPDSASQDTRTTPQDTTPQNKRNSVQDMDSNAKDKEITPQDTHNNMTQDMEITVQEDIIAQDEHTPPQDTDTTPQNTDTTTQDEHIPLQDTDTTAQEKHTLVQDTDTSVQDEYTPVQDTDTSVQDEQTPTVETNTTPQDRDTTTQDEHTSVQDTNVSVQEDTTAHTPVQDTDTTAQDTHQDEHTTTSDTAQNTHTSQDKQETQQESEES